MVRRILTVAAMLAFTAAALGSYGGLTYHEVQITDEVGRKLSTITSVTVRVSGTTDSAVIYSDRARTLAITQPMTSSSTNTTLDTSIGTFYWFGAGQWDYTITDGTNTHNNSGFLTMSGSDSLIIFPSYLTSINTTSFTDAQTQTFGTGADWVFQGGNEANVYTATPASDNAEFRIGVSGTTKNSDFNVYVGTLLGLKLDAGVPSLTWDGGAATINHNSNFNTGINSGTSTGTITLGSATAGAVVVDTTSTIGLNSDGQTSIVTTDASADVLVDASAGSVIIRGTEAIADAVWIDADAGGIDLTSAATFDIDVTATGGKILMNATEDAAGAISMTVNGGTSETIVMTNTQGTGTDSFNIDATAGGIDIDAELEIALQVAAAGSNLALGSTLGSVYIEGEEDAANAVLITADGGTTSGLILLNDTGTGDESIFLDSDAGGITLNANAGSIDIEAVGAGDGDIGINAGDDMAITAGGNLTLAVTGTYSVGGAQITNRLSALETVTTETNVVAATESGTIYDVVYTGTHTTTLPQAAPGLIFTVIDGSATAADDVIVDIQAGDNLEGDTNGDGIQCVTDEEGSSITFVAITSTRWIVLSSTGTWGAQ